MILKGNSLFFFMICFIFSKALWLVSSLRFWWQTCIFYNIMFWKFVKCVAFVILKSCFNLFKNVFEDCGLPVLAKGNNNGGIVLLGFVYFSM